MKPKNNKRRNYHKREEPFRVNERIRAPRVRLVGDNVPPGVYTREEALQIAQREEVDLVEVSPNADPPVCKIVSYSKFKYDRKKKLKELNAKTPKNTTKEIRMFATIGAHDIETKTNNAIKLLGEGTKISAYVQYRGREMYTSLKQVGMDRLNELATRVAAHGKVDEPIRIVGRRAKMTIVPMAKKK